MKPLEPPDKHYLLAAQGWLELGNSYESFKELEKISPEFNGHPDVLGLKRRLYSKSKNWISALTIAKTICQSEPNHLFSRIHNSYEFYALKRTVEEKGVALAVPIRLPCLFAVPYNLACYACQLGDLEEAWEWFKMAVEMSDHEEIRSLALNDPDLEPLWAKIEEI